MRALPAVVVLLIGAGEVRAEETIEADAEAEVDEAERADDGPFTSLAAGVGAGASGAHTVSAAEVRGDLAWGGDLAGAVGVGARLRVIDDRFARADWDELADWMALVRYVELRSAPAPRDAWRLHAVVGTLDEATVGRGTLVDGLAGGVIADRRVTGAHARMGRGDAEGELMILDLARPAPIAAAADVPAGPVVASAAVAIDPETALVGFALGAGLLWRQGELDRGPGSGEARIGGELLGEPGRGVGAALVASAARGAGRVTVRGRGELGAGSGGFVPAPFGPLYLRLREAPDEMTLPALDGARAGIGGAAALALDVDGVGAAAVSARHRPGLGPELTARAAFPTAQAVQAAARVAWMPRQDDALVLGAEVRALLPRSLWSAFEASRQYGGLYAERPVWQVTAWFGVAR